MTEAAGKRSYWPFLDGLRGLAVLLVITHNINAFNGADKFERIPAVISHAGWIGVQIFFVLSGFLITHQLLQSRGATNYFSSFYMRRALRIFPLYFLALTIGLFVVPHFAAIEAENAETFSQAPWLWVFLSNWTQPFHGTVYLFSHFWSLAVEEQFYLIWPAVIFVCARGARVLHVCIAIVIIAFVCRCLTMLFDMPTHVAYMTTVCRMDALAIGAAAAWLLPSLRGRPELQVTGNLAWLTCTAALLGCALLTRVFDLEQPLTITVGYLVIALVTGCMILISCDTYDGAALPALTRRVMSVSVLRSVGRYSYAMYVIHFPLLLLTERPARSALASAGLDSPVIFLAAFTFLTYLLGVVSYHLFERHFLALKLRFVAHREPAHAGGAAS
ncbi:MAG: acyltransferase [Pseudomonadota bacterium]|nr:acyltransferase [Pseudomonadota bacterium]